MQRIIVAELIDTDNGSPAEIAATLADMCRINCWFGGTATTLAMLRRVARRTGASTLSMLEVAAGSAYVPEACRQILAREGIKLNVTLLDRAANHLNNGTRAVAGDAFALPFADSSFDVVSSTLFAHHLEPEQIPKFAEEALRVSRHAMLINDLIRNPFHLALVYAGLPFFSRMTRHDAPASVRRAYTPREVRGLLARTPARMEIDRRYLFRMAVMMWK